MKSIQPAKLLQDTLNLYNTNKSSAMLHIEGGSSHFNYTFESGDDIIKIKHSRNMHGAEVCKIVYSFFFNFFN